MASNYTPMPPINNKIKSDTVHLIDQYGENRGLTPLDTAIAMAKKVGLELMAINIQASPPVAKILDVGKYKYEIQKKRQQAKKKQKIISLKEVKFRPTIEEHDFQVKTKAIKKFLEEGDKVKISIVMRGREIQNKAPAYALVDRLKNDLKDFAVFDDVIKAIGRQIILNLSSRSSQTVKQ